jgi:nitroreductase
VGRAEATTARAAMVVAVNFMLMIVAVRFNLMVVGLGWYWLSVAGRIKLLLLSR